MSGLLPIYYTPEEVETIRELVHRERAYIELVRTGIELVPHPGSTEIAEPIEETALQALLLKADLAEQLNMEVA